MIIPVYNSARGWARVRVSDWPRRWPVPCHGYGTGNSLSTLAVLAWARRDHHVSAGAAAAAGGGGSGGTCGSGEEDARGEAGEETGPAAADTEDVTANLVGTPVCRPADKRRVQ